MPTYFLTQYCVLCICGPQISGFSLQKATRLYNIFCGLSPTISYLNHIPGFSPEGGVYPYLLHPFTHVLFMPCNCEPQFGRCPILLSSPRTPITISINHVFPTYIEHKYSVNLPCPHNIHRTLNIVSIYHGRTPNTMSTPTMHSHLTRRDVPCINAMQMSLHAVSCLHVRYVSHSTYLLHYMSSVMDKL